MRIEGWIFLAISWGGLIALACYCTYKILTTRDES